MAPAPARDLPNGYAGHEERLLRVEDTVQDVAVKLSEVGTRQEFMVQALDSHREDLTKRLDEGFSGLRDNDAQILKHLDAHQKQLADHAERLKPIETSFQENKASQATRRDTMRNIVIGILLAGAGAVGAKLADSIWTMLASR